MQQGKKFTTEIITAACGHEYKAGILYKDEQDLREQRVSLAQFECIDCIEAKQKRQEQTQAKVTN